jgi:hypothetical protein
MLVAIHQMTRGERDEEEERRAPPTSLSLPALGLAHASMTVGDEGEVRLKTGCDITSRTSPFPTFYRPFLNLRNQNENG